MCRLGGPGRLHRRLDLLVVPWQERASSLLYFTGSNIFNRLEQRISARVFKLYYLLEIGAHGQSCYLAFFLFGTLPLILNLVRKHGINLSLLHFYLNNTV